MKRPDQPPPIRPGRRQLRRWPPRRSGIRPGGAATGLVSLIVAGLVLGLSSAASPARPPASAESTDRPARLLLRLAPSPLTARVRTGRTGTALERELAAVLAVERARPLFPEDEAYRTRLLRMQPLLTGALPAESGTQRRERLARFGLDRWIAVEVAPGEEAGPALIRLGRHPLVELAEADGHGRAAGWITPVGEARPAVTPFERRRYLPDDPRFDEQWYLDQASDADIDMPEAWEIARSALEVPVAVLDSGVDDGHPDLCEAIRPGYDYVNGDDDPADDNGHGTHVTGLIAAGLGNGIGIAGAAGRTIVVPLKVLRADLWGYYSDWAAALRYAADLGVRVANLSAGGISPSALLEAAVDYCADRGTIVCTAMMNENTDDPYYPAAYPGTIAVGATDRFDRRAAPFYWGPDSGSCYGPHIDLVAPGDSLISTLPDARYGAGGGTSQATPLVSAVAALMIQLDPFLTPDEVRSVLRASADDRVGRAEEDSIGFDIYHGAGRLNAAAALLAVATALPPPTGFTVHPPHPNPSRGFVGIAFKLAAAAEVSLTIYDVRGRLVARPLARTARPAGYHTAIWNGEDQGGRPAPSGIYLFELTAGRFRATGKLTRIR